MSENKDIIHLQNAHVTQYSGNGKRSEWKVRMNITSEDIADLPGTLTEEEVFKIMEFARKFELIAFNRGISFGNRTARASFKPIIETLERNLKLARNENERIATKLDQIIISKE